jgi:peroxiredoxin
MVANYLILLAVGMAVLLSAPLHAAWQGAAGGTMLGKRLPALPQLVAQPRAGVVLVDFWEPRGEHCQDNVAVLNRLQRDFHPHGLTIVGIARAPPAGVADRARCGARDYPLVTDPDGALFAQLGFGTMPSAVLVDRNGIVVWQGDPGSLSRATIEQTLAAPAVGALLRW